MHVLPPESLVAPRNRWDMTVEAILGALLVFMPATFGAVEEWSELIVVAGAAALALIVAVRAAVDRTFRLPRTAAYWPVALFLLLVALQLTPLPRSLVAAISPATVATRAELLGDADAPSEAMTISLYPLATARGLRMALVAAAIFIVTAAVFRTAPQVKRLLAIVFIVGCAQALLALLQLVTQAQQMYWLIDAGKGRLTSGSFVNYSNFSQFMNLSIGAGAALLLVRMQEEHRKSRSDWTFSRPFGGARMQPHAPFLAGLILCALSVFTSMSRNGAISLVAAAAVVAAALYARGTLSRRGWLLAMAPLGVAAVLLLFAFDAVYDRLATLHASEALADRWQLTLDVLRAWSAFPIWGIGLNAHEYVFSMFDTSVVQQLAAHADNDYAQLLEEMGVVGASFVAAFVFIIGRLIVKLCRRGRTSLSAAAFGLTFGLVAVAIHSATDFGQRLPAVFCLSAVTCGLVVQIARLEKESKAPPAKLLAHGGRWPRRRLAAVAAVLGVVAIGAWSLTTAYRAFLGEQWWALAYQIEERIQRAEAETTEEDIQDLLAASQHAQEFEPGNVTYGYWLNARRWFAVSQNFVTGAGPPDLPAEARPFVERIADELTNVRRICPPFGPPHALEGQLRLLVLGDSRGAKLIEQGVRLAPYDPPTCLIAGQVAAQEGRIEDAAALITRAVNLHAHFYREAAEILLFDLKRPDLARKLAGDDYMRLSQLADVARARADLTLADEFGREAETALRRHVAADGAAPTDLARLGYVEMQDRNYSAAIDLLRRALTGDYNQVEWRLELARALAETGELEQAAHEAQICLRLRPSHAAARELSEEIGRKQARARR